MTEAMHLGSTLAEAAVGKRVGKGVATSTVTVSYMRAVKLPKCPACGTPNTDEHNKICTGCGGPTAEPCELRYVEEVVPSASMLRRLKRFFRKG